jgi:hypothetical protein
MKAFRRIADTVRTGAAVGKLCLVVLFLLVTDDEALEPSQTSKDHR